MMDLSVSLYIIVCEKLKERIPAAVACWNSVGLTPILIRAFDSNKLDFNYFQSNTALWSTRLRSVAPDLIDNYINLSGKPVIDSSRFASSELLSTFPWLSSRGLADGEYSVLMKHFSAINAIAYGHSRFGIISEDDVRYPGSAVTSFWKDLYLFVSKNGDYMDLAGGCGLNPFLYKRSQFNNLVLLDKCRTRTNACYVISKRLAQLLLDKFFPLVYPIDWHLQWCFNNILDANLQCYWTIAPPLIHGSEFGLVSSWRT